MTTTSIYKTPEGQQRVMALYDAVLARWPVPYEALKVATRHGETAIIASGEKSAPPLLLLHGSSSNATAWIGDMEAYSRQFRVYAVDTLGEPGKSAPNRPPWDGPAFADWLEDVLAALQVAKVSLVGISQGGWLALKFATSRPERVEKLVLLAPGGVAQVKASFLLRALTLRLFGRRGAEAIDRIVMGRDAVPEEAVRYMNVIMTNFRPRVEAQALYSDEALQRLTMPVMLIAGLQDALFPSAQTAARLQKSVPHLSAHHLPEAGHVLHNTAGQILPFLAAA